MQERATERHEILDQIRRTAEANGGAPLGQDRFATVTGITESVWGRYWARFGDAQREAGVTPNRPQEAYPDEEVFAQVVRLMRELGTFPTYRDLVVRRRQDRTFPSPRVFRRLGPKARLVAQLLEYGRTHPGHDDIVKLCTAHSAAESSPADRSTGRPQFGSVYLLKGTGRMYKIGRTSAFGRRRSELAIQLPFDAPKVHVIETDDPEGVEAYWHNRFAAKRRRGEWFELDAEDVRAFKRWKRLR